MVGRGKLEQRQAGVHLRARGRFTSSKESGGKGVGAWMRDGNAFVMYWPRYDNAIYVGTIRNSEIRGSSFDQTGKAFGKFKLKLMQ